MRDRDTADPWDAGDAIRRRVMIGSVVLMGAACAASVVMLALRPELVTGMGGGQEYGTRVMVDLVRLVTSLDLATDPSLGAPLAVGTAHPLTNVLRYSTYAALCAAILLAVGLGVLAAIRASGLPGVGVLSASLATSALGLSLLYVVVLLVAPTGDELARVSIAGIEALGAAALGFAGCGLLNFATRFPVPLPAEEIAERVASKRVAWGLSRGWPFLRRMPAPPARREKARREILRALSAAGSWWLPVVAGCLLGAARLVDPFLGMTALWWLMLAVPGGTYLLLALHHEVGGAATRVRLTWILGGVSTAVWAWVLLGLLPFALGPLLGGVGYGLYLTGLFALSPPVVYAILVGALAMAAFYQGAIDPRLAVRRSTLAGVTTVVFVIAFGGIENLASGWVEGWLGLPGAYGSALTGALLALALLPFRGRLEGLARRFEPSFLRSEHET